MPRAERFGRVAELFEPEVPKNSKSSHLQEQGNCFSLLSRSMGKDEFLEKAVAPENTD